MSELLGDIDTFELAAVGMIITDRTGYLRRVNTAFAFLLGRDRDELLGMSFSSLTSPEDVDRSNTVMRDLLNKTADSAQFEKRYIHPDGSAVWVELHIRSLTDTDGAVVEFLVQVIDITAKKLADAAAARDKWRLEEAERITGLGGFELDSNGVIRPSDELCRISGLAALEDISKLLEVVHPDDRDMVGAAVRACLEDRRPVNITHRLFRSDRDMRWVQVQADWTVDVDERDVLVGTMLDITDRKRAEDVEHQGFHDPLTGLANRALFLDRAEDALNQREAAPVAMVFLDLDNFKTVNDNFGHPGGDQLLVIVGHRLASVTRVGDTVARFGGDEFAMFLRGGVTPKFAEDVARRIEDVLRSPVPLGDSEVVVSASIGIAVGQPPDDTSATLLRDADLAMYLAKQNGKGRIERFRPAL